MIDNKQTVSRIKDVLKRAEVISNSNEFAEALGMLRGFLNIMLINLEQGNKQLISNIEDVLDRSEIASRGELGFEGALSMLRDFLKKRKETLF